MSRRYGEALLDLLSAQQQESEQALPAPLPAPLNAGQREKVKVLKKCTEAIAAEMGVAPQALVSGRDFEALVRGDVDQPARWSGWRRQQVIEPLQALLRGDAA